MSKLSIPFCVAVMEFAEKIGVQQGPELNILMSTMDDGYEAETDDYRNRLAVFKDLGFKLGQLARDLDRLPPGKPHI